VDEVSLGDTVGAAVPTDVYRLLDVLLPRLPRERLALHAHDTSGTALANIFAALEMEIATFDSSAGGLGGCPYAPGATGNLASEDLIYMLDRMGIATSVSLARVAEATALIEPHLAHPVTSKQYRRLQATGSV
jgi:hydroxymethylglutaryl-CoA lyase